MQMQPGHLILVKAQLLRESYLKLQIAKILKKHLNVSLMSALTALKMLAHNFLKKKPYQSLQLLDQAQ